MTQEKICIRIGISRTHNSLPELNSAFHETSVALNQQILADMASSYHYYVGEETPMLVTWPGQEEFLFRIESGMSKEVIQLVESLFDWFLTIPKFTLTDAKYCCYVLSDECRIILNSYSNQKDIYSSSNSMQNVIGHIFHLEELKVYYTQFFSNIAEILKGQSVYSVDDIIERIQIYIQRNYQKNITQDFVSSLFYINRSYLSTLFKAKTGQKFVDYLNDVRIDKAKELLLHSDRKMYQIAKLIGYDNIKYFFRIFKKKTGMTPEQFRICNREQ